MTIISPKKFYQKLEKKIASRQREKSISIAHREHEREHSNEYIEIYRFLNMYIQQGGLQHKFGAYKLWSLVKLLEDRKPKRILELGSGSSTLMFANYVKNFGGKLDSYDESSYYQGKTKELIKTGQESITVNHAERIYIPDRNPKEMRFNLSFNESYDLVFIDGPSFRVGDTRYREAVNSDVFSMHPPQTIVVDGRFRTAIEIEHRLKGYDCFLSDLIDSRSVKKNYQYFSVFFKKLSE